MKIVIGGGARCGKTSLAELLAREHGLPVYHADDLIHLGWSEASDAFADVIEYGRDGIYEGVAAVRALRKLLKRTRARPITRYIHLTFPRTSLTEGQRKMNVGIEVVHREIRSRLRDRGVELRGGTAAYYDFSSITP